MESLSLCTSPSYKNTTHIELESNLHDLILP